MKTPTGFSIGPYVLVSLDVVLATYAGVSPHEPIGEPVYPHWQLVERVLRSGRRVNVLTWRVPGLVIAWMERAKLTHIAMHQGFDVVNAMPDGLPEAWISPRACSIDQLEKYGGGDDGEG